MQRETLGLGVEFTAVDPWTTWVWTTQIHPSTNFFPIVNTTVLHCGWLAEWGCGGNSHTEDPGQGGPTLSCIWIFDCKEVGAQTPKLFRVHLLFFFFFLCMTKWSLFKQHCQVPSSQIHLAVKTHANILSFHLHNKCLSNPHIWISKRHLSYCLSHRKSLNILSASCLNFQFKTLGCCSRKVSATRSPGLTPNHPQLRSWALWCRVIPTLFDLLPRMIYIFILGAHVNFFSSFAALSFISLCYHEVGKSHH